MNNKKYWIEVTAEDYNLLNIDDNVMHAFDYFNEHNNIEVIP